MSFFKQSFTIKIFLNFVMANACCFILGGNLDFLQKALLHSPLVYLNADLRPH